MRVVIVASGLATRLYPITNNIPKLLVNVGKETAVIKMLKYWTTYTKDITIILNSRYRLLTEQYINLYFPELGITYLHSDIALGSAHAIFETLPDYYEGEELIFTWSDLVPNEDQVIELSPDYNHVFLNTTGGNRYKWGNAELEEVSDNSGDVIGIYHVAKYRKLDYEEGQDFADVFNGFGSKIDRVVLEVTDFGDKAKLQRCVFDSDDAREFNELIEMDDFYLKKPRTRYGEKILRSEIGWYEEIDDLTSTVLVNLHLNIPAIYPNFDHSAFFVEKIEGRTFSSAYWDKRSDDYNKMMLVESYLDTLGALHRIEKIFPKEEIQRDIMRESHGKLVDRCNVIKPIIDEVCGNIQIVNGKRIMPFEEIVENIKKYFANYSQSVTQYSFIHGDPNFSNAIVDRQDVVWLIDPRGYFGYTDHYGDPCYDRAKVLYGCDGYDLFNYHPLFSVDVIGKEISFDHPSTNALGASNRAPSNIFGKDEQAWLMVIWICLAEYIKNDIHKSCAAFYHGLYMATKFFEERA